MIIAAAEAAAAIVVVATVTVTVTTKTIQKLRQERLQILTKIQIKMEKEMIQMTIGILNQENLLKKNYKKDWKKNQIN